MPAKVAVTGLREFVSAVKAADKDLLATLKTGHQQVGQIIVDDAQRRVPRRSGALARSIKASKAQAGVTVSAGGRLPYGRAIHFGWPSRPNVARGWRGGPIRPAPFLYDAVDARADEVVERYAALVDDFAARGF